MAEKNSSEKEQTEQVLITRVFDAPRGVVFKAWTDCERLMRWWGPKGFTTPFCKIGMRRGLHRPEGL